MIRQTMGQKSAGEPLGNVVLFQTLKIKRFPIELKGRELTPFRRKGVMSYQKKTLIQSFPSLKLGLKIVPCLCHRLFVVGNK